MPTWSRDPIAMPGASVAAYAFTGRGPHAASIRRSVSSVRTSEVVTIRSGSIASRPSSCSSARAPTTLAYASSASGWYPFSASTISISGVVTLRRGTPSRPAWNAAKS